MPAPALATEGGPDVEVLEAALKRRNVDLRFAPAIERAYEQDRRAGRNLRIGICNIGAVLLFAANTALDDERLPHLTWILGPLHRLTIVFVLAVAALVLWQRDRTPTWLVELITALGTLMSTSYIVIAVHSPPDDVSGIVRTGGMFLVFAYTALTARQHVRYCLGLGVLGVLGYASAARPRDELQAVIAHGNIRLLATTLVLTLLANYVLEYRERRAYLLRTLDQHRRRALTQDAEALHRLTLLDALTGVANRRHFDAALQAAWAEAAGRGESLALLELDVDFFKRYNDHYGHPAGDACLQRVARVLRETAEAQGGTAARIGGEEFALLLPRRSLDEAAAIGQAVCAAVRALRLPHADSAVGPWVTVSIGAAAAAAPGGSPQALLLAGDEALYGAKHQGRDRVVCAPAQPAAASEPEPPRTTPSAAPTATRTSQTAPLSDRIDKLTAVLDHGLHWLRFPPALEAAYLAAGAAQRARWLSVLGVGGIVYAYAYLWVSRPLLADVADSVMRGMLLLSVGLTPVSIALHRPMPHALRESLFSASASALCIVCVWLMAPSHSVTVYSYSLSLFLVSMFCAVAAAQPFRYSLVTSLVIWGAALVVMRPVTTAWRTVWIDSSLLLLSGVVFSSVGGYLIDLSARRDYLLHELAEAQRALLTDNAARLRRLADSDALTGLANRRKFDAELAALIRSCADQRCPLSLLIVDIDHFKRYNDRHGHPAGDACLRRVAQALAQAVEREAGASALTARLGGEEFAVLLPGHDCAQALALADRLCARVRRLDIAHGDSPVGAAVTVSIGAACLLPTADAKGSALLSAADAALYEAKQRGRDRAEAC